MGIFDEDEEESGGAQADLEGEVVDEGSVQDTETLESAQVDDSEMGVVKPVTSDISQVETAYEEFDRIKNDLLQKNDLQTIGGNAFITKSGWRKIATAFGVSTNITSREKEVEEGVVTITVTARAEAPNGQAANGVGACSSNESNFMMKLEEDTKHVSPGEVSEANAGFPPNRVLLVDGAWRGLKKPKEVNFHDLVATAATRAKNRAISDLVGGGDVSAEELDADQLI